LEYGKIKKFEWESEEFFCSGQKGWLFDGTQTIAYLDYDKSGSKTTEEVLTTDNGHCARAYCEKAGDSDCDPRVSF